jgi:hypothetical protein
MRLEKGQHVTISNPWNRRITGTVIMISENQRSAFIGFDPDAGAIRTSGGGLILSPGIPLLRDSEEDDFEDLWGTGWEVAIHNASGR